MTIQYQSPAICIFESSLYRTTSTVIHSEDCILIVDPTWLPYEIAIIQAYVEQLPNTLPQYLLFTHSDYDHIIAWQAFPNAQTIASLAFVQNPDQAAVLDQIKQFDEEYYIQRNYPIAYPQIDIVIKNDQQQLTIGATQLHFYLAPGHNADGIFTIVEPYGIFIAGDYLSNIEFPYIYHSSIDYEQTLHKVDPILKDHDIQLLIPGHGDITASIAEIEKRKKESLEYILQLRTSIRERKAFDEQALWNRYAFPGGMKDFHKKNGELMTKEEKLWEN